jgi:hypothetical protein
MAVFWPPNPSLDRLREIALRYGDCDTDDDEGFARIEDSLRKAAIDYGLERLRARGSVRFVHETEVRVYVVRRIRCACDCRQLALWPVGSHDAAPVVLGRTG